MTRSEAIAIRSAQLSGGKVSALELQEAIATLNRKSKRGPGRNNKFHLPSLPRPVRERVNAMLCFNLGRALKS